MTDSSADTRSQILACEASHMGELGEESKRVQTHLVEVRMTQKILSQHKQGWWPCGCKTGTTAFLLQCSLQSWISVLDLAHVAHGAELPAAERGRCTLVC